MNRIVLSALCLSLSASFALGQEPAQPPAPAIPAPGHTTPKSITAGADKSGGLSQSDKALMKRILSNAYFVTTITGKVKHRAQSDSSTKDICTKVGKDINAMWAELTVVVNDPREIPNEVGASDKNKLQRVEKSGTKYDAELLELLAKECNQLENALNSASKTAQNDTIKSVSTTWFPKVKAHADEAAKAAKTAAKAK